MALYVIGDPHLALGCDKPMDIFAGWRGYTQRLADNWQRVVHPEDTVVVAGDVSWGMSLEQATADFAFLHALPGHKILLKGNHDYWWTTMAKMESFLAQNQFHSIHFLHNNSYEAGGVALCGTRGWLFEAQQPQNAKVMAREVGRLRASLQAATAPEKLVFLHYPPLYTGASAPAMIDLMETHGVKRCFYGHLHGEAMRWAVQGEVNGINYKLISADSLNFYPYKIET